MEYDVREALCEVGRRVWQRGFVASNDGNFSYRLDENTVLATPTLISKGAMRPEDLVLIDLDGRQIGGARRGTSEIRIHLNIDRRRPDVRSVVHVHPPHATAFAIAGIPLPKCILPEVEFFLGEVPLVPYATPGTWEFAHSINPWVDFHDAFILRNHGAVTVGADPFDAYYKMETLDQYCRILMLTRQLGGEWNRLDAGQMRELLDAKKNWGLNDPRAGQVECDVCDSAVPPTIRPLPPAPYTAEPANGYPMVSDEPKPSAAEAPSAADRGPAGANRELAGRIVREVLRRLG